MNPTIMLLRCHRMYLGFCRNISTDVLFECPEKINCLHSWHLDWNSTRVTNNIDDSSIPLFCPNKLITIPGFCNLNVIPKKSFMILITLAFHAVTSLLCLLWERFIRKCKDEQERILLMLNAAYLAWTWR